MDHGPWTRDQILFSPLSIVHCPFPMRLGTVSYSNVIPLIHGLPCDIFKAPPSQLAKLSGPDDIIMSPVVTAFLDPDWYLIEGVGIGSFGAVDTVKLFFRNKRTTIQNIKTIYIDSDSLTSLNLLKILFQNRFERNLNSIRFTSNPKETTEGALLIGDKVWKENPDQPFLDLGEAWTEWTKLPFVFACWMTKNPTIGKKWKPFLIETAKSNLQNLEKISQETHLLKYWKKLYYDLGEPQKRAIALFQRYCVGLTGIPLSELRWI
ncbi:MAG: hypothetical protein HY877_08845 [Deltaproteobacteria bacterium]|nr:hypothetical protein [Deltaproteobacteria bacterium]